MAYNQDFGVDDAAPIFTGEDKLFVFTIYEEDDVTPKEITGWALEWVIRRSATAASSLMTKTTAALGGIVIAGTFNVDPLVNTQRAEVTVADTDTESFQPGNYAHALKRTDTGLEAILSYGTFRLRQAASR